MAETESFPIAVGRHGAYEWLVGDHCLDDLLELCPQTVLGKYIAITSIDSGSYFPSEEEIATGWEHRGDIAYSPKIASVEALPHEGWDEWYVFEHPADLGKLAPQGRNPFEEMYQREIHDFVNYNLGLHLPNMEVVARLFWKQFDWIQPFTYIAESDSYLTVISTDKNLVEEVHQALSDLDNSPE